MCHLAATSETQTSSVHRTIEIKGIFLFGVIHNPTRISDRMVASIGLLLRKNSPEAFTRRVRLEEERFIEVGKSQNWA